MATTGGVMRPPWSYGNPQAKVLIPVGMEYRFTSAGINALPTGAQYGKTHLPGNWVDPNKTGVIFDTRIPVSTDALHVLHHDSRHTLAADVKFDADYLAGSAHMGLCSRHSGQPYTQDGDNQCLAVIGGTWEKDTAGKQIPGCVGVEAVEGSPTFGNLHFETVRKLLVPGVWYRMVIDTIYLDGGVGVEVRLIDRATGQLVYQVPPTTWVPNPLRYIDRFITGVGYPDKSVVFSVLQDKGVFTLGQTTSWWSPARTWVPNP